MQHKDRQSGKRSTCLFGTFQSSRLRRKPNETGKSVQVADGEGVVVCDFEIVDAGPGRRQARILRGDQVGEGDDGEVARFNGAGQRR